MSAEQTQPPIVALDTETTGLNAEKRQVYEVAMVHRPVWNREDEPDSEVSFFVEVDLEYADPFALNVGKFWDRHPMGRFLSGKDTEEPETDGITYLTTTQAAHAVVQGTFGAHVVGAVPHFDTESLERLIRFWGLAPNWHYHLIDVGPLMLGFLRGQGLPVSLPWGSDELAEQIGVDRLPEEERHTALGDAKWTLSIFDRIMQ